MGRKIQPRTLKTSSLLKIVDNLERRWRSGDYEDVSHILGPPECLTPDLVQEIVNHFTAKYSTSGDFLERLIDGRLDTLDLHECERAATDQVLKLVSVRCQRLTQLRIYRCSEASVTTLCQVVRASPKMMKLQLYETKTNDEVLTCIGQCCRDLRELTISGCAITDKGLENLCISLDDRGTNLPKLRKIEIRSRSKGKMTYTWRGVWALWKHCPSLRTVRCDAMCDILYQIHRHADYKSSTSLKHQSKLHISERLWGRTWSSVQVMQAACELCPNVTDLAICAGFTDEELRILSGLEHVTKLHIVSRDKAFSESLQSYLNIRGDLIVDIRIFDCNHLDIDLLGRYCPNLKNLFIFFSMVFDVTFVNSTTRETGVENSKRAIPFQNLIELEIDMRLADVNNLSGLSLKRMLMNCLQLRVLKLTKIKCLDYTLLSDILVENPLRELEVLHLTKCPKVTMKPLSDLCRGDNALKEIHLESCGRITRKNRERLREVIRTQNFEIETEHDYTEKICEMYDIKRS